MKSNKVLIFDTTLRDGEQAPGATMSPEEKLEIAFSLERLGVDIIEAGFPISSKGDFDSVQNVARRIKNSFVCGLARCVVKDIDAVIESVKPARNKRIHIFLATSKIHLQHKLKKSQDEIVTMAVEAVKYARKRMDNIEFSPEDASRTEKEFLYRILEAVIKAGAGTVNIPDTVGYSTPQEYGAVIAGICNNVPNIGKAVISTHCHDDLGLAVVVLSGVQNGARQVQCTINGIGERAGNASMEEIVMAIKTRSDFYGLSTDIKTKEFFRISRQVSKATGFIVPPNKAIVGANAFRHESGIHQDGVLKERRTYEIMNPEEVGVPSHEGLVLGKHSGRHAFKDRLKGLGIELPEVDLDRAFVRFKDLADKKKEIYDEDLVAIVEDQGHLAHVAYTLVDLISTDSTTLAPQVVVTIQHKGKKQTKQSTGYGPVDACYKAIGSITKLKADLLDYGIKSVTQGMDALGDVTVKVAIKGETVIGRGASTDIIEASAKAYINAINKFVAQQNLKK